VSEFLAEAQVRITPDTTSFRAELVAELTAATRGVAVPIPITAIPPANLGLIAAESTAASRGLRDVAAAQTAGAEAARRASRQTAEFVRSQSQLERGAAATALSLAGVRGATLAASSSFLAGAAAVAVFAKAIQGAAGLETELNVLRITAQATAEQMEAVRNEARALGRDVRLPGVSSRDAAEAMTELARAGLEVEDSIAGARGVLQLAAAAQISNAEATELAASALNAFGLAGDEAVHVADLLANAANEAQGSISDMGLALRQSAAVGRQVGLSLEDTTALLTILARNGLQSSDAGTALRTSLIRLINPTARASGVIRELGLRLRDAQGNIRPEVFAEFAEATQNLSKQQRDAALAIVFGQDAIRAAAILGREGAQAFNETADALDREGAAAELAAARSVGLTGQMSALASNLETLGTTLGGIVLPPLTAFVSRLNELVTAAGVASDGLVAFGSGVRRVGEEFEAAVPGGERFLEVLKDHAFFFVRGGIAGQRVVHDIKAINDAFTESADEIRGSAQQTIRDVRDLFASFQEAGGGPTALNQMVLALDAMANKLAKGDAEGRRLSRILREIIREVQAFEGLPPTVIDIEARFDPDQIDDETDAVSKRILENLSRLGGPVEAVGAEIIQRLGEGMARGATSINIEAPDFPLSAPQITRRFEEKFLDAEIANERARQLRVLRAEDALIAEQLAAGVKRREKRLALKKRQEQIQNEIESIEKSIASDARESANKIEQARRERDQNILASISLEEARLQNQAITAAGSKGLADDIRTNLALRDFYRRSIEEVRKTVEDAKVRAQTIAALTRDLITANREVRDARKAQREEAEKERQERQDARLEALSLNLELAVIKENEAAERRALQAIIRELEKRIAGMKGISNKERELRNELARRRKQLKELREEAEENTDQQALFEFLQKQQGFAANLLGNLIPRDATAGLVGGSQAQAVPTAAGALQAQAALKTAGPTFGQAATEVSLLDQVLRVLIDIRDGRAHPEAAYQRVSSSGGSAMDVM
jgi:TP901 family phage tail tape measure protein